MKQMPPQEAEQLVINTINKDRAGRQGVRNITREIAAENGIHLTRQFVSDVMHHHFPEGFARRDCTLKRSEQKKGGKTFVQKDRVSALGVVFTNPRAEAQAPTHHPTHDPISGYS